VGLYLRGVEAPKQLFELENNNNETLLNVAKEKILGRWRSEFGK